jgi:hypothetical protein
MHGERVVVEYRVRGTDGSQVETRDVHGSLAALRHRGAVAEAVDRRTVTGWTRVYPDASDQKQNPEEDG